MTVQHATPTISIHPPVDHDGFHVHLNAAFTGIPGLPDDVLDPTSDDQEIVTFVSAGCPDVMFSWFRLELSDNDQHLGGVTFRHDHPAMMEEFDGQTLSMTLLDQLYFRDLGQSELFPTSPHLVEDVTESFDRMVQGERRVLSVQATVVWACDPESFVRELVACARRFSAAVERGEQPIGGRPRTAVV